MAKAFLVVAVFGGLGACGGGGTPASSSDASSSVDASGSAACVVDEDCPEHAGCDLTSGSCVCVSGYGSDATGACTWVGGIIPDPGFGSAAAWTSDGDSTASVDPTASPPIDPGEAIFTGHSIESEICEQGLAVTPQLSTAVVLPERSRSEPFVLVGTARTTQLPWTAEAVVGASWLVLPGGDTDPSGQWTTSRQCLGPGNYAAEKPASGRGDATRFKEFMPVCLEQSEIDVDHVDIVPADPGECPDAEGVRNGDAEADDGWTLNTHAAFVAGAGTGGSRAVVLSRANSCDIALASAQVAYPVAAGKAVQATITATAGSEVELGNAYVVGTGSPMTVRSCVPARTRGAVAQITTRFGVSIPQNAACTAIATQTAVLDDVQLVDDASCGADPTIANPGFEGDASFGAGSSGAGAGVGHGQAQVLVNSTLAHSGNNVLELAYDRTTTEIDVDLDTVAPSTGTGGPMITLFYNAPAGVPFAINFAQTTPIQDGAWHQAQVCGHAVRVTLGTSNGGTPTSVPRVAAYIDDVAITRDPSCPEPYLEPR